MSSSAQSRATTVAMTDNSTTVSSIPAVLTGIYVNVALPATNGTATLDDGGTAKVTLPVSLAAGTMLNFPDVLFSTNLVANPDDAAASGSFTVFWRAL